MNKKTLLSFNLALMLSLSATMTASAEPVSTTSTTMENSGAFLFEWRPVDCGNGQSFAILVGGNTINESDVILNRGYDYGYTFNPAAYPRPWGQVPDLVNINGIWGIPENWALLPEGSQSVTRIVLLTNNKNFSTNERYVDVTHLPDGVSVKDLPEEVRKYLINVDGSDAGAYNGTTTSGWVKENNQWKYRKPDGSFVAGGWLNVDQKSYYMNDNGIMLADTITPDGIYVNPYGEKTGYFPGWIEDEKGWRYILKNGKYAGATWIQDVDGSWYYFNIGTYMETDDITPDGYRVGPDGVWDGNPSSVENTNREKMGPGASVNKAEEGWEVFGDSWKYRLSNGDYATNSWKQDDDGKWYYFDESSLMVTNHKTPDGYFVGADGVWDGKSAAE